MSSGRLTVTLSENEIVRLLDLGAIARDRCLSEHGQDSLARLAARIAERVKRAEVSPE